MIIDSFIIEGISRQNYHRANKVYSSVDDMYNDIL